MVRGRIAFFIVVELIFTATLLVPMGFVLSFFLTII